MRAGNLALLALLVPTAAIAQTTTPDRIQLSVTPEQLQIIGNGVSELPYKTAAPVMIELQRQLKAHRDAAATAGKDGPKKED